MLKLCKINACPNGTLGLHLSRAPWDPYPWVSGVQESSSAYQGGVRIGDTVLELNGNDILGQKISEMAMSIHGHWDRGGNFITFLIWRNTNNETNSINQQSLQKFATCLQNITQLLECPVCLEVVKPPGWQCCNGHVLCNSCRGRTVKCPICRVTLGPRGRCLLSDKLFTLLAESFPCDGVKQGNNSSERRCPEDYHNHYKTSSNKIRPRPLNEIIISKNIKDPTLVSLPVPLPLPLPLTRPSTQEKQQVHHQALNENQVKDETSNIIKLKMNSCKQRKHQHFQQQHEQHLVEDIGHVGNDRRSQITPLSTKDRCKNYHCPTGKLCFTSLSFPSRSSSSSSFSYPTSLSTSSSFSSCSSSSSSSSSSSLSLSSSSSSSSTCADNVDNRNDWQVNRSPNIIKMTKQINIENIEKNPTSWSHSKMPNTDWEILSHLTRTHHIAVAQYYGTFDEKVRVEFMNSKSIPCISISSSSTRISNEPFSSISSFSSLSLSSDEEVDDEIEKLHESATNGNNKTSWTPQNNSRILLNTGTASRIDERHLQQQQHQSNEIQQQHHHQKCEQKMNRYVTREKGSDRNENSIDLKSPSRRTKPIQQFFVARIPLNDYEDVDINSKSDDCISGSVIMGSNHCTMSDGIEIDASQSDVNKTIVGPDLSSSFAASRTFVDFRYSNSNSASIQPGNQGSSIPISEQDDVTTTKNHTDGNLNQKRCAVFIWYCGSNNDIKNLETVIECKRTDTKWTGCIHPLTRSWNSVRQSGNYLQLNCDVEEIFDIVIKIK